MIPFSGAPVRYCYYYSAGIARTVYTISTCPKYLLPKRRYKHHHEAGKSIAHRKHHAHCAQSRRGQHFRVRGQVPYQAFGVPRDLCQKDSDDDAAATIAPSGGDGYSQVFLVETNNNEQNFSNNLDIHSNGIISTSHHGNSNHNNCVHSNSITDNYSEMPDMPNELYNASDHVCLFHAPYVLGDDPKYREILKQYNTRVSFI